MRRSRLPLFFLIFTVFGGFICCSSDKGDMDDYLGFRIACKKCGLEKSDMSWLESEIQEAKTTPARKGSFYAISTSAGTVIVHQPVVMSCLACLRYDCYGNTPVLSDKVIQEEVLPGMTRSNLIYEMEL